jgi:hypothetical protein
MFMQGIKHGESCLWSERRCRSYLLGTTESRPFKSKLILAGTHSYAFANEQQSSGVYVCDLSSSFVFYYEVME